MTYTVRWSDSRCPVCRSRGRGHRSRGAGAAATRRTASSAPRWQLCRPSAWGPSKSFRCLRTPPQKSVQSDLMPNRESIPRHVWGGLRSLLPEEYDCQSGIPAGSRALDLDIRAWARDPQQNTCPLPSPPLPRWLSPPTSRKTASTRPSARVANDGSHGPSPGPFCDDRNGAVRGGPATQVGALGLGPWTCDGGAGHSRRSSWRVSRPPGMRRSSPRRRGRCLKDGLHSR